MQAGRDLRSKKNVHSFSTDRDTTVDLATISMSCRLSELEPVMQRAVTEAVAVITEELCQLHSKMEELDVRVNEFDERIQRINKVKVKLKFI